jgi:hypothetical protein
MTGDDTSSLHKKVMKEKAVLFVEASMGFSFWRSESAVAYNSFYLPSLGYGMCATTLSFQEFEDIQRPVVNTILPKMGFNRKSARSVVFRTAQFGGLVLGHLATLQGHSRLQYIVGHIRCGDHIGQLVRMLIEYTQLECGAMDNILKQDYDGPHRNGSKHMIASIRNSLPNVSNQNSKPLTTKHPPLLKNLFTTNDMEYQLVPPTATAATPLKKLSEFLKNTWWQGSPLWIRHFHYTCGTDFYPKRKSL